MNKLKVALAQIDYRPAFILESHELLVEPIFSSIKEPHTSISLMEFKGSEKISGRLLEKYISWLRVKIVAIIKKCIELSVDLIVFPEYSVPFQVLKDICLLTKGEKIRVVAGTHIVVKTAQQLPEGYPDPKKYLKCAMMPIIADGKVQYYTFKNELTTPMLNEFIEKVVVHEADKSTGDRRQKVDIYFNFIGCFVPPKPEVILTAEEEAKAQKALAVRNRERKQNKLRMRRVREAQRAAKETEKVY